MTYFATSGQNGILRQAPYLQRVFGDHEELQGSIVSVLFEMF